MEEVEVAFDFFFGKLEKKKSKFFFFIIRLVLVRMNFHHLNVETLKLCGKRFKNFIEFLRTVVWNFQISFFIVTLSILNVSYMKFFKFRSVLAFSIASIMSSCVYVLIILGVFNFHKFISEFNFNWNCFKWRIMINVRGWRLYFILFSIDLCRCLVARREGCRGVEP